MQFVIRRKIGDKPFKIVGATVADCVYEAYVAYIEAVKLPEEALNATANYTQNKAGVDIVIYSWGDLQVEVSPPVNPNRVYPEIIGNKRAFVIISRHARYHGEFPAHSRYSLRYPPSNCKTIFAKDTSDFTKKLVKIRNTKK